MPWTTQKPRARHRARSQAPLNAVREEDLRKQRIPIQIVLDLIDKVFQSIGRLDTLRYGKWQPFKN